MQPQIQILIFVVLAIGIRVNCEIIATNSSQLEGTTSLRKGRDVHSYLELVSCAMSYDVSCFLDTAQNYLERRRSKLLSEADAVATRYTGRSDPDSKPSQLAQSLNDLISEFTGLFKDGFMEFFQESKEDAHTEQNELTTTDANGESRELDNSKKKKKKKPLKSLIRLVKVVLVALIVVLKLAVLLKVLQTAMQFKFLLISLGGFAIQAAKFWMTLRNQKDHGHEEIVYKNPYSVGSEEYSSPGGAPYGAEYNTRKRRRRGAQALVYRMQKPKFNTYLG